MSIALTLADSPPSDVHVLGVPVFDGGGLDPAPGAGAELDLDYLTARRFEATVGEAMAVPADDGTTVVAIGMGPRDRTSPETIRKSMAAFVRAAWNDTAAATTILSALPDSVDPAAAGQAVAEGAVLAGYGFTRYKGHPKACQLESLTVVGRGAKTRKGLERGERIAAAVAMARDLVNEPAGTLTPARLADVATELAARDDLEVTVWDEARIREEGLGGLLGVAAGSEQPPRLIRLVYDPPGARATVALVGKGITFDSGGLSIKTAEGMETMKTDMSGAAAVLATMSTLRALGPKVKVIGIVPTTENMPGGRATKPGDVLTIRNGKTVEVLNTDAEGRLVLADGLSLAVEAGADAIVDVATLTGACIMALGRKVAGLMGNSEEWTDQVRAAAERAGEAVWPLPLPADYRKQIESDIADIRNISTDRYGGALTAGLFLEEFVDGVPWAHLDIAGPARAESDDGYVHKGGTGVGVRTLVEVLTSFKKPARRRG